MPAKLIAAPKVPTQDVHQQAEAEIRRLRAELDALPRPTQSDEEN